MAFNFDNHGNLVEFSLTAEEVPNMIVSRIDFTTSIFDGEIITPDWI